MTKRQRPLRKDTKKFAQMLKVARATLEGALLPLGLEIGEDNYACDSYRYRLITRAGRLNFTLLSDGSLVARWDNPQAAENALPGFYLHYLNTYSGKFNFHHEYPHENVQQFLAAVLGLIERTQVQPTTSKSAVA